MSSSRGSSDQDPVEDLPERFANILQKANLSAPKQIFTTSVLTFNQHGLNAAEVDRIRTHYAPKSFSGFGSASSLLLANPAKWRRITFGCASLDRLTRNGLATRGLTELSGEAGAGKSQLCMQLALTVQLPHAMGGLDSGAVYISTEGSFASGRLHEMIGAMHSLYGSRVRSVPFGSRVFLEHMYDVSSLLNCVGTQLPCLMSQQRIGLICIDSVAGVFRSETDDVCARAMDMRTLARALMRLSDEHNCAVLCVNQVTAMMGDDSAAASRLVPCLGLAWSNLVSTRLQLHRNVGAPVRSMEVVFSPTLPPGRAEFIITGDGVTDVLH